MTAEEPAPTLYHALGQVVFHFGQLEESLHDAVWMALGQSDHTRILTADLRFPDLVTRFRAIYREFRWPHSDVIGVDETCTLLSSLNEERNRELHATWGFWADSGRPMRMRRKLRGNAALTISMESVEPATLESLAQRLDAATDLVWQIILDFDRQQNREPAG
jgi:hypothetical protein